MAVLLVGSLPVVGARSDKRAAIRVYVTTVDHRRGNEAATPSGLEDSTTDVREALAKRKGLAIVPTAEEAQVRVEVVDREERDPRRAASAARRSPSSARRSSGCASRAARPRAN